MEGLPVARPLSQMLASCPGRRRYIVRRGSLIRVLVVTAVLCGVPEIYSQQPYVAERQRQMLSPPSLSVITEHVLPGEKLRFQM